MLFMASEKGNIVAECAAILFMAFVLVSFVMKTFAPKIVESLGAGSLP